MWFALPNKHIDMNNQVVENPPESGKAGHLPGLHRRASPLLPPNGTADYARGAGDVLGEAHDAGVQAAGALAAELAQRAGQPWRVRGWSGVRVWSLIRAWGFGGLGLWGLGWGWGQLLGNLRLVKVSGVGLGLAYNNYKVFLADF